MPRGNRVLMLRDLHRDEVEDDEGTIRQTGYTKGVIYNFPTHMAKALVRIGYAEFYATKKDNRS
jgi:hypothetical protein